ncbi:MAG: acyl-CoA dehydrogenase family protein [Candidatus Eisenbacteria bacterium]|uniref:Acyl-CoA dehydrogenase family protein n=1 Tax=Eiseniibacteriota bacterium TaxID=2212470 RepID=A0A937X9R4_UNCEI|nr:acyl-CoA dehydrogenase family protein [Candidatus Eisenbacteria bacterium]
MDLNLTDEQEMILQGVREFARGEIAPRAREMDAEAYIPSAVIEQMRALGLFGAQIPEAYGGLGLDTVTYSAIIEELARACAGVSILLSVHASVAAYPLMVFAGEEQRRRFLPRLAAGEIGAFCLSEPGSGSDAASLKTSARRDGDGYVLNGAKVFVSSGSLASLYLVMARSDPQADPPHRGISAFLVEREAAGIVIGRKEDKMGLRADDTMEVFFEDCRVPAANRIGEEGAGFKIAMKSLDSGRIGVGAQAIGIAQAACDAALAYARERQQFGRPLAHFQAIQNKLADMAVQIEAARLLVHQAAWLKDRGRSYTKQAAMAKLFASEMSTRVAHQALQIHGGYGYMKDYAVERYYRDARVTEIYEGTSEMQRLVIARQVLRGE